ncbi:hypothetical protein SAMN05216337_1010108 [Bradyrhizobium brasilense]|uniref:Uncharacterized protein n=1 Tax=Bradyrhizobium brasilense TaxID=1419277 RepID=A0A1G6U3J1_9BRAD|nr:hypothetical protein SAMN05216337_1010108 [Bradyrhizobium brasilense]
MTLRFASVFELGEDLLGRIAGWGRPLRGWRLACAALVANRELDQSRCKHPLDLERNSSRSVAGRRIADGLGGLLWELGGISMVTRGLIGCRGNGSVSHCAFAALLGRRWSKADSGACLPSSSTAWPPRSTGSLSCRQLYSTGSGKALFRTGPFDRQAPVLAAGVYESLRITSETTTSLARCARKLHKFPASCSFSAPCAGI